MATALVVCLDERTDFDLALVEGDPADTHPDNAVAVADPDTAALLLRDQIDAHPNAAAAVIDLLRHSLHRSPWDALYAESIAYSALLGAADFRSWRASNPAADDPGPTDEPVVTRRDGDTLSITLNRPERRNAMSRWVRDAACAALDIAVHDPSLRVRLSGSGPAFCAGGDLAEFGANADLAAAHFVRLQQNVGWRVHLIAERVVADVHGACVGAGIEIPAFARRIVAQDDAWFQLPELAMGLLPGAGGTVSLPRRIGPWRTAWLALSGQPIDVKTALAWGLVDERGD
ncbi:MAG: enoyl-CoA hydratase/isomerase family protein [Frankiaceae bacterium]|nr:enoyl-CoA hydratase/isomerase family protein [Frankiaceae bacterium]MBV9869210.1 enoyl-CoA hydratase/isomerase family protein [Frankiaceae bacterium]